MVLAAVASCSDKEVFTEDASARLEFSDDTVHFDTIFTSIGSATKRFKIYNKGKQGVRIPSIRLGSGGSSGFRVNLDGRSDTQFSNVEIYHGDSIFCFVEVTVNPHDSDSPILLADSLVFTLPNGKTQQVILQAYGQDIIILKDRHIDSDTTLDAKRPYVIYDSLTVDSGSTLTLKAGTTLCFHSGASLNIHGKVIAEGEAGNPVTMRCDRTDKLFPYLPYDRTDAQWGGITIYPESEGNRFVQCDIHGGSYGIRNIGSSSGKEILYMLNTILHNVAGDALCLTDAKATIHGCQISNAQGNCATITGGDVEFCHCTLAQFYPWTATYGNALYFTNYIEKEEHPLHNLSFVNSVITGYADDELFGSPMPDSDAPLNYHFIGCLINTVLTDEDMEGFEECQLDTIGSKSRNNTKDVNTRQPKPREGNFRLLDDDNFIYDFRLDTLSAARKLGIGTLTPEDCRTDMNGTTRDAAHPDAGCYQFEE